MYPGHQLSGLFDFARKPEWQEALEEAIAAHFGPVAEVFELELEEILESLDEQQAVNLMGCAFEDLLTLDPEPGVPNIADEYLKRRGWKESPATRAYIRALRGSVMSLYEVSEVIAGASFLARDLIRGGEPVLVSERSATQSLRAWDRIAARIVEVGQKRLLAGGVLPFPAAAVVDAIEAIRLAKGKRSRRARLPLTTEALRDAAPVFTTSWLFAVLPSVLEPRMPDLQTSDGDPLEFRTVRFPLIAGASPEVVTARLDALDGLEKEEADRWVWLADPVVGASAPKSRWEGLPSDPGPGDARTVLGQITLTETDVRLTAFSATRATAGSVLLGAALAGMVRAPLTEIQTVRAALETAMAKAPPIELATEEAKQAVHAMLDRQYLATLDEPVPMLGDRTPRELARTASGRRKVADWLKYLENRTGHRERGDDPMATYDFGWMWRELGVEDLRR